MSFASSEESNRSQPDMSAKLEPTSPTLMSLPPPRYTGPKEEDLTDEQQKIRQEIISSRPGTGWKGPFGPWLVCPKICSPAQTLGRACRYGTSLSLYESELIILLTAAKTKCPTEFDIHQGEALIAGLSLELIQSIPRDDDFNMQAVNDQVLPLLIQQHQAQENTTTERVLAMAKFCAELLETSHVSDETYQATLAAVGGQERVLVEMTSIVGYYTYVAYTLNVFRIPSK